MSEITLQEYQNEIDQLVDESRYLEALAHLRHVLKQYPRYFEAYYLLGKTMLEADLPDLATDMFRRALSANPEHLVSRIGLGLAHERRDDLDAAIWNLERALEIDPGNEDIAEELRRMVGRRDGVEPNYIPQTQAGLARLYIRGSRYGRAAEELRALLEAEPSRPDLLTALAEAYWRDEQFVQASEVCQTVLDTMPHNCKANLLLGALWMESGQREGRVFLERAKDVDPEGHIAKALFGADVPVEIDAVTLERLTYEPDAMEVDRESNWFKRLEAASVTVGISEAPPEMTESEVRLVDITAGLESQIEIPEWLREIGVPELEEEAEGDLDWMSDLVAGEEEEAEEAGEPVEEVSPKETLESVPAAEWETEEIEPTVEEELPAEDVSEVEAVEAEGEAFGWLQGLTEEAGESLPEDVDLEEAADWLGELGIAEETAAAGEIEVGEGAPDWLQDLVAGSEAVQAEAEVEAEAETPVEAEEMPDWLSELGPPTAEPAAEEELAPAEDVPDWLDQLEPAGVDEEATEEFALPEEGAPDWLSELQVEEEVAEGAKEVTEDVAAEAEGEVPDWLASLEPEETAGAAVEEAPSEEEVAADMVGEVPDWLRDFRPDSLAEVAEEEAVVEEDQEGLAELETEMPEAIEEVAPSEEEMKTGTEVVPTELAAEEAEEAPALEMEGDMLSGDDALAWLESFTVGKEEELRAQAEAEAEARTAELLGRKREAEAVEAEAVETEAAEVEMAEAEAPEAEPAIAEITEAETVIAEPPEAEVPEGETLEAAAPAEAEEMPDWLSELEPAAAEAEPAAPTEDVPDWLDQLQPAEAGEEPETAALQEEGAPDWVSQLQEAGAPDISEAEAAELEGLLKDEEIEGEDVLGWLAGLEPEEPLEGEEATAVASEVADEVAGDLPDWLDEFESGPLADLVEEETLVEGPPDRPETEVAEPVSESVEEVAEDEDALAWLESLAGGEEEEETLAEPEMPAEAEPAPSPELEAEVDTLSGDDALAWLESLTIGKEDALRAQAEAEAETRAAEILGRKPKAEVALEEVEEITETVEEVAPIEEELDVGEEMAAPEPSETVAEEAPVPEVDSDMLSGDDALAWLESLTVGKEEELRAQAEAESEARTAEILGRKPKAEAAEEPSEPEAVAEAEVEADIEPDVNPEAEAEPDQVETVAEVEPVTEPAPPDLEEEAPPEEPSTEDALSWLQALGEEEAEDIEIEIETQAAARIDDFETTAERAEPEVAEEQRVEPQQPAPPESVDAEPFGWTAFASEVVPGQGEMAEEAEVAFGFTHFDEAEEMPEAEAEAMEVERQAEAALQAEVEAELPPEDMPASAQPVTEIEALPESEEEVVEPPVEPEVDVETVSTEPEMPIAEPEERVQPQVEVPAEDDLTAPEEVTLETEEPAEETVEVAPEAAPEAEAKLEAEIAEEVEEKPEPEAPAEPRPEAQVSEVTAEELDEMRAYAEEHEDDEGARLALARALWQADEIDEAMGHYESLVESRDKLDEVLTDMERYYEERPNSASLLRTLGDAYMKAGDLDQALKFYNRAMDLL